MAQVLDIIGLVSVATLFGSMAFFSCVVAPLVFIKLEAETAGRFIRAIFPWYYLVVVGFGGIASAALLGPRPVDGAIMGAVALGAIFARQVLMPRINHHRDRKLAGEPEAEKNFARLHRLSVWINAAQLLAALVVLVRLGLV